MSSIRLSAPVLVLSVVLLRSDLCAQADDKYSVSDSAAQSATPTDPMAAAPPGSDLNLLGRQLGRLKTLKSEIELYEAAKPFYEFNEAVDRSTFNKLWEAFFSIAGAGSELKEASEESHRVAKGETSIVEHLKPKPPDDAPIPEWQKGDDLDLLRKSILFDAKKAGLLQQSLQHVGPEINRPGHNPEEEFLADLKLQAEKNGAEVQAKIDAIIKEKPKTADNLPPTRIDPQIDLTKNEPIDRDAASRREGLIEQLSPAQDQLGSPNKNVLSSGLDQRASKRPTLDEGTPTPDLGDLGTSVATGLSSPKEMYWKSQPATKWEIAKANRIANDANKETGGFGRPRFDWGNFLSGLNTALQIAQAGVNAYDSIHNTSAARSYTLPALSPRTTPLAKPLTNRPLVAGLSSPKPSSILRSTPSMPGGSRTAAKPPTNPPTGLGNGSSKPSFPGGSTTGPTTATLKPPANPLTGLGNGSSKPSFPGGSTTGTTTTATLKPPTANWIPPRLVPPVVVPAVLTPPSFTPPTIKNGVVVPAVTTSAKYTPAYVIPAHVVPGHWSNDPSAESTATATNTTTTGGQAPLTGTTVGVPAGTNAKNNGGPNSQPGNQLGVVGPGSPEVLATLNPPGITLPPGSLNVSKPPSSQTQAPTQSGPPSTGSQSNSGFMVINGVPFNPPTGAMPIYVPETYVSGSMNPATGLWTQGYIKPAHWESANAPSPNSTAGSNKVGFVGSGSPEGLATLNPPGVTLPPGALDIPTAPPSQAQAPQTLQAPANATQQPPAAPNQSNVFSTGTTTPPPNQSNVFSTDLYGVPAPQPSPGFNLNYTAPPVCALCVSITVGNTTTTMPITDWNPTIDPVGWP